MNAQNAAAYLPLVQALAEGKTIQFYDTAEYGWVNVTSPKFDEFTSIRFRIKPEPPPLRQWWIWRSAAFTEKPAVFDEAELVHVREVLPRTDALLDALENGGLPHSCSDACKRPACILRRERDMLKAALEMVVRINSNTDSENQQDGLPDIHDCAQGALDALGKEQP